MKYMGSKRMMLQNGLGALLSKEATDTRRFVDLFAGSGAVSVHFACRFDIPVLAFDLQCYSAVLTGAVIGRQTRVNWETAWGTWHRRARARLNAKTIPTSTKLTQTIVDDFREWCGEQTALPI